MLSEYQKNLNTITREVHLLRCKLAMWLEYVGDTGDATGALRTLVADLYFHQGILTSLGGDSNDPACKETK